MSILDIYGHFGTTYSYATVGANVARAMWKKGSLGTVYNLDPAWHPSFADLRADAERSTPTHVLVFAPPNHYIDAIAKGYEKKRTALFVSPNTDTFIDEHAETAMKFGRLFAPSVWCKCVVERSMEEAPSAMVPRVVTLPLGVSSLYSELATRVMHDPVVDPQILHLTSDQAWPGRKGTEEMVQAWAITRKIYGTRGRLVIHAPQSLEISLRYLIEDNRIGDTVDVHVAPLRGATDAELVDEYAKADLIVLPSRAEGFGMMMLAALVARVPLLTTYATGQADFLAGAGGWMAVPSGHVGALEFEDGNAPVIDPDALAQALAVAAHSGTRMAMRATALWADAGPMWGTWTAALPIWVGALSEWMKETE